MTFWWFTLNIIVWKKKCSERHRESVHYRPSPSGSKSGKEGQILPRDPSLLYSGTDNQTIPV